MSKKWDYNENKTNIIIDPPTQRLRITGHRIASVLGLNKYQSAFGAWCEITKLVKLPFEDNKFTLAGKAIEPKQIEYIKTKLPNILSIEEYYGNNFKDYQYNNFKDDSDVFGGVIDLVSTANDMKTIVMIGECKTSSKPQEWANNNVPVEYLLQGALYSYIKGLDKVVFVCSFLEENDYNHPEMYKVDDKNTTIVIKKLDELLFEVDGDYLNIEGCIQKAQQWWDEYIETGVSPKFDEKVDKEYLDIIRSTNATKDDDLSTVCIRAYSLYEQIEKIKKETKLDDLEKQLKSLQDSIKEKMLELDIPTCEKYKITKKVTKTFNSSKLQETKPELYNAYCKEITKVEFDEDKFKKDLPNEYDAFTDETISSTLTKEKIEKKEE